MLTPADYLRDVSIQMEQSGYTLDCVAHACALAELLLAAGHAPWIGRIRDTRGSFHGPLTPLRFTGRKGPTWTTHYVCCADGEVYDPMAGRPLPLNEYGQAIFGRSLPVEEFLSPEKTRDLSQRGQLRPAFRLPLSTEVEHGQRKQRAQERNEEAEEG